ncbi:MAG: hypothetical protein KIT11_04785 [Fimbriimonadaceae bacterium]|nr:hypothetical protein [Fimbriimonadaceae bacterium]QYK56790.1 MAG: hypothetical protein KF733_04735 [Fimbriimonadaceae bacterium]
MVSVFLALLMGGNQVLPPAALSSGALRAAEQVSALSHEGDFAQAEAVLGRMPRLQFSLEYDDSAVAKADRPYFAAAKDRAFQAWKTYLTRLELVEAKVPHVRVSFAETLPGAEGAALPAGAVCFESFNPDEPCVDVVIALHRETSKTPIDAAQVENEVLYAIGRYLGVPSGPMPGGAMDRTDEMRSGPARLAPVEAKLASENVRFTSVLEAKVKKKEAVNVAFGELFANPMQVRLDAPDGSFEVVNRGDAPLRVLAVSRSEDLAVSQPDLVEPGASKLVQVRAEEGAFAGPFRAQVDLYANDLEKPVQTIEVVRAAGPRYEFRTVGGDRVVVGRDGVQAELLLSFDRGRELKVDRAQATDDTPVDVFPWALDPEPQSGQMAVGYRLVAHLEPFVGEKTVTVTASISDPALPTLSRKFTAIGGSFARPSSTSLAALAGQRETVIVVASALSEFEVTGVTSDLEDVEVSFARFRGNEFRIRARLKTDHAMPIGSGAVRIKTNDPERPEITVLVKGQNE